MLRIFGDSLVFIWNHPVWFGVYLVCVFMSLVFAVRAIDTARTSQGAIAWVGALISFPVLAVPLFCLFGRRKFEKYVRLRGEHDAASPKSGDIPDILGQFIVQPQDEFGQGRVLRKLSDLPFTSHNSVKLLIDGADTFALILEAIAEAEHYILFQFYILRDDEIGQVFQQALIRKAQEGVAVYVLYDRIGSYGTSSEYFRTMLEAGIHVNGFKTTKGFVNPFQLNFRNHRKIVITDGRAAFVGGHNIGDEYLGKGKRLTPWRDTHLRIEGPAVQAIQLTFVEDWRWATSKIPILNWEPSAADENQVTFVLPSSPADEFETCGLFFQHVINSASRRIWIASPYFVPDQGTLAALQVAALRGVDVRILLPGMPDHLSPWYAAHSYFEEVLKSGVRIFQMKEGFMHQKVVLLDNNVSVVGTANFDNRSFRLNFEISIITIDEHFAQEVRSMLESDMRNSHEVSLEVCLSYSTRLRIASRTARLLSPIL